MAEEEGGIDDCTAIVCILQHGNRARRTGSLLPAEAAKISTAISRSAMKISHFRPCKPQVITGFVRALKAIRESVGGLCHAQAAFLPLI